MLLISVIIRRRHTYRSVLSQALEYARTIAKPSVSPRLKKEAQEMTAAPDQARYLSGVDMGQLTILESLRKRHELEKQAVAQFKAVQAI